MTRIEKEFNKLRKMYSLKTKIYFDKELCKKQDAEGLYISAMDYIVLPDRRFSKSRILTLLHEICHAIQHKENRGDFPRNHTIKKYTNEIEAELFSFAEYKKIYESRLGKCDDCWRLAHYDAYRLHWLSPKYKLIKRPMNEQELTKFMSKLDRKSARRLYRIAEALLD